jgi:hypothetical protein
MPYGTPPLVIGLLPESILHTGWFAVLATFVAINTVMYCALAVAKSLPKVYPSDWDPRRRRRTESRSIHPTDVTD